LLSLSSLINIEIAAFLYFQPTCHQKNTCHLYSQLFEQLVEMPLENKFIVDLT